jgi:signal transduction protein with GAF and PtsI domain
MNQGNREKTLDKNLGLYYQINKRILQAGLHPMTPTNAKGSLIKKLEALSKISKAISSDLYLEDILSLIVVVTAEVMKSKVCSLWLLDERDNALKIRATQAMSEEYLKERSLKLGEGVVGYVAVENRPMMIYNVLKEPRYKEKELAKIEGLVSMLSVPMCVKDKVIGVINCYTSYPHKFNKSEVEVFTTVANQAAIAIENAGLIMKAKMIEDELISRKLVERAKGILMKEQQLSEEEAFRRIQKKSMDLRKTMREIAEAIILANQI